MSIDRYDPNMFGTGLGFCPTGDWVKFTDFEAALKQVTDKFQEALTATIQGFEEIELWYVKGIAGTYYVEKIKAEAAARAVFHDESPDQQYARIFFRRFYREVV